MTLQTILFHYGTFQPDWQQPGLIQAGPQMTDGPQSLPLRECSAPAIRRGLAQRGCPHHGVLLHYSDPFMMRSSPLRDVRAWPGPRLLACGDLHHGPAPIDTLVSYLNAEPHDAVLLTFNPSLVNKVQSRMNKPVRSLPPTFFNYPSAKRSASPRLELLHVGTLGPHHPRRRELIEALNARRRIPLRHTTTNSPEEAAVLYAQHALVLNVPLNNDLNHRFFEVMAAGVPQVVFGDPGLVGEHQALAQRPDVFWASTVESLEELVLQLLTEPKILQAIPVQPPPVWPIKDLLKAAFTP